MDISLDFETLGLNQHACPIQMALVLFNPDTGQLGPSMSMDLNVSEALITYDCIVYPETLEWWSKRKLPDVSVVHSIPDMLNQVRNFMGSVEFNRVWAKNPCFDIGILERLFIIENHNAPMYPTLPWEYNQIRDWKQLRETAELLGFKMGNTEVKHKALDDAIQQAKEISAMLKFIKDFKANSDNRLISIEQEV